MQSRSPTILAALALATAALTAPLGGAVAQAAPTAAPASAAEAQHLIPQSQILEHQDTLAQLALLVRRKGPIGVAAAKVMVLYKKHAAREEEFIFPPLTLLPYLADGKVTPDMAWALPMTDRVKAEQEQIFIEHTKITDALNNLVAVGAKTHDKATKAFAESGVADSLADLEIMLPTVLLIGETLHSKLPAAH